jgi:fibronectin-binding autotransporter adhesin
VSSGGTASGAAVSTGGVQTLAFSGTASGTVVSSGGEQDTAGLFATGSSTTVLSGGVLLMRGGNAVNPVLSSGATATAINAGGPTGATVLSGATLLLGSGSAGGGLGNGTVLNGGEEIVSGGGAVPAEEFLALVNSGALELVESGGQLFSATISGGTVDYASGAFASGILSFAASGGGTVQLDEAKNYASSGVTVSGFNSGDDIEC